MPYKDMAARYLIKNCKVYVDWLVLDNLKRDSDSDTHAECVNVKNARKAMAEDHPEYADYVLRKSKEFYWYVVYVEVWELINKGFNIDLDYYQIKKKN